LDLQAYISSGILEAYVLDQLSPAERAEVQRMLAQHAELRKEVQEIEDSLWLYAQTQSQPPPKHLKAKVLAHVMTDVANTKKQQGKVVRGGFMRAPWAVAASLALFVASAAVALYLGMQWQTSEQKLLALQNEKAQLADNYTKVCKQAERDQAMRARMLREIDLVSNKGFYRIELAPAPNSPAADSSGSALVYWNDEDYQTYFICSLPSPPPGKQFQLWALYKGKPVDAGMISKTGGTLKLQAMKTIRRADAFAVTLEPDGGSEKPTLSSMYIMGKVGV
jgi:anti-sigma-K factor RskA